MFDFDNLREIFDTIKKNKLRTFLTGFSVAWGIFMLIILLAFGNGFKNGVMSNFGDRAKNSVELRPRSTSMPYSGNPTNRQIKFDEKDFELVDKRVREAENVSASISVSTKANHKDNYSDCEFLGVYPVVAKVQGIKIIDYDGRFINELDMKERRKVAVINKRLKEILFKYENPVGKTISANSLNFTVIGVYESNEWGDNKKAFLPFTTAQTLFNKGWGFGSLTFTVTGLDTKEENEAFEVELRKKFAALHQFHPEDDRAINIWNTMEDYLQTMAIFNAISLFVWATGILTLIAGVVGVSNIMLITVRERTREFGIRKALGAKPFSILRLILLESVLITSIFGYFGMVFGIGISEAINWAMENATAGKGGGENEFVLFKDPTVSLTIAFGATALLVAAGVLAGYFPARKAIKITAVEAMRAD